MLATLVQDHAQKIGIGIDELLLCSQSCSAIGPFGLDHEHDAVQLAGHRGVEVQLGRRWNVDNQ